MAKNIIKPRLQSLPGAADVRIFGDRKFSMRVWLDESKLAAYRLTVQDVENAIREQNLEKSLQLFEEGVEISKKLNDQLKNAEKKVSELMNISKESNTED